jgi:outer membrane receptor protein involved in Fe transport
VITGLSRGISRIDPHVALVFRPERNDSYRAAWGTSETFPFVGDVSGTAAYQPFAQSAPQYTLGVFTEKNPNLQPEYSSAYDLGADHRFGNGGVLSVDLEDTTVHNVFQQLTLAQNTTFQGKAGVLGIFLPVNVARLRAQLATLKYTYAPRTGLGYGVALAADRSIIDGIPPGAYNGNPGFPVNNVQECGNGLFTPGLATCVPYLKGYGHLDYTTRRGDYASLGIDYEGKNNPYYQPPFAQLDLTVRHAFTKQLDFQIAVQNLLNTNSYSGLPAPNAGVPIVAETSSGLTAYQSTLLPLEPRTVRFQLREHVGR